MSTGSTTPEPEESSQIEQARLRLDELTSERDYELRKRELTLKEKEQTRSFWSSPVVIALGVAALGLVGNAVVALVNGIDTRLEDARKAENDRVLEVIKVGNPDQAAANLRMLVDAGLYTDSKGKLRAYLDKLQPGQGAFLPAAAGNDVVSEKRLESILGEPALLGVGVSHANRNVDFADLKRRGFSFVYAKSSEGVNGIDPMVVSNVERAKAAGLRVGIYHFFLANEPGDEQAEHFEQALVKANTNLPPIVDCEANPFSPNASAGEYARNLHIFLHHVETHLRVKPVIYTGRAFAAEYLGDFGGYRLALADLSAYGRGQAPKPPAPWTSFTFWHVSEARPSMGGLQVDQFAYRGSELPTR